MDTARGWSLMTTTGQCHPLCRHSVSARVGGWVCVGMSVSVVRLVGTVTTQRFSTISGCTEHQGADVLLAFTGVNDTMIPLKMSCGHIHARILSVPGCSDPLLGLVCQNVLQWLYQDVL